MTAYKNARAAMTTGGVTALTVPASKVALVTHIQISNVDGSSTADATVHWTDDSNSDAVTRLAFTVPVLADNALSIASGGLVLEAGDTLVGTASADGDLEMSVSYVLEDV